MFKKSQKEVNQEKPKEIWAPPKPEKTKYEWFARHVLLANVEGQLNDLENQDYSDIQIHHIVTGTNVSSTSVFITARKRKKESQL